LGSFKPNLRYPGRVDIEVTLPRVTPRTPHYIDKYWDKHRSQLSLRSDFIPMYATGVWVAPSATIIGCVELWQNCNVWYNAIIRGDVNLIKVGSYTNIQDRALILEAHAPLSPDHDGSTIIGHYVTVGHGAILKACTVEDHCTIGMGAILEEGSYMETHAALGAHSVLKKNQRIPQGELWLGNPAKFVRKVESIEVENAKKICEDYVTLAETHESQQYFDRITYRIKEKLERENKLK